jgi:anti-anti-sigma factor
VLTFSGELNRTSIAALEVQIDQIGCSECSDVVLDVFALRKLDSVGTRVLIGLDHYVRALGAALAITGATGQVAEALASTQLSQPMYGAS